MNGFAHVFVTRSTALEGDGSRIDPKVPPLVSFFYDNFVRSFALRRVSEHESERRKREGDESVDAVLKDGLSMVVPIDSLACRVFGRILGIGSPISVFTLKIKPDTDCDDPRARNPDFVMHVVMYQALNFSSAAFKRFVEHCREVALAKKTPGVYRDLVVPIPDEVLGHVTKGAV